ncbi:hypothetical protein Tcan_05541, partial [Toxocara canis]
QELKIARRKSQWRNRLEEYNRRVNRKVSRMLASKEGAEEALVTEEVAQERKDEKRSAEEGNRPLTSKCPVQQAVV